MTTRAGIAMSVLLALALVALLAACGRKAEKPPPPGFTDEGAAVQKRASRSLNESVVTADRLRGCWAELKGEGVVAFDLNYRKSGDKWLFEGAQPGKSSLAPEQTAAAQRCMEGAARGSSFAADLKDGLEAAAPQLVLRLGWPVPLPPEGGQLGSDQIARMVGGGGGAGAITIAGCSDCQLRGEPPYGYKCVAKKSGSQTDCEEVSTNVCATTPKACLRGVFGGGGGIVMY